MPAYKHPTFVDRLTHSAEAKTALITRYQTRPGPNDPQVAALAAERLRLHEGRLARQAERQRLKEEEHARQVEALRLREQQELEAVLAREAELEAIAAAAQQARRDRLAAKAVDTADQKAQRDARYAARKSRQKR